MLSHDINHLSHSAFAESFLTPHPPTPTSLILPVYVCRMRQVSEKDYISHSKHTERCKYRKEEICNVMKNAFIKNC